VEEPK